MKQNTRWDVGMPSALYLMASGSTSRRPFCVQFHPVSLTYFFLKSVTGWQFKEGKMHKMCLVCKRHKPRYCSSIHAESTSIMSYSRPKSVVSERYTCMGPSFWTEPAWPHPTSMLYWIVSSQLITQYQVRQACPGQVSKLPILRRLVGSGGAQGQRHSLHLLLTVCFVALTWEGIAYGAPSAS